ncbi:MAG: hypothetical protein ABJN84_11385 [Flavobacteriaceae bacterium]
MTKLIYLCLLTTALIFTSCQEEFEEVGGDEQQETITASSSTALLIENTSSNDGSFDNIVDGASCFAIEFPYTVEVNGVEITIDSREDLHQIEAIFDEVEIDDDILDIIFPITITLADFTEIVIENKEELRELAAECLEGGDDDDIECIDFVYPITMYTFNVDNQVTGEVVIESDKELRRFFAGLEDNDLVSIDFPITLKKYDGTEMVVDSNAELARALEAAKDECDEDDDDDYNDDDFTKERLDAYLVECPWIVREVIRMDVAQTDQYFENVLNFMENGEVMLITDGDIAVPGTWSTSLTDDGVLLSLTFEQLADFTLEWIVYEIDERVIKLYAGDGDKIILKQYCENGPSECRIDDIAAIFEYCKWRIEESNEDFDFEGTIDFSNRNIHAYLDNGAFADEGNWEVTDTGFRFNALIERLEFMLGDWTIVACGEGWVKIQNANGRYLVLRKDCDFEVPNIDGLREILKECEWIIKKVKNQGEEIDRLLGYEFKFLTDNVVTLSNGETTSTGSWEIGLNDDGALALLITMGEEPGVSFDWPLRDLNDTRLRFEVEEVDYELVLLRVCDDNASDGDIPEIRNIMMGGAWNVAKYTNDDVDSTSEFDGLDFYFNGMHQIQVDENNNTVMEGLWRVIRNDEGKLKFYLNFDDDGIFGELTDDWHFESISTDGTRLELVHEDENSTEILVFEKQQ